MTTGTAVAVCRCRRGVRPHDGHPVSTKDLS